jgi:hypothetical protein
MMIRGEDFVSILYEAATLNKRKSDRLQFVVNFAKLKLVGQQSDPRPRKRKR